MSKSEPWHLDKRIPVALICMMIGQVFGLGYFVSNLDHRIANNEDKILKLENKVDNQSGLINDMRTDVAVIRQILEGMEE